VGRVCGFASGRWAIDEDHAIERVLADAEDVEAAPRAKGRPERIALGPGAQYSTR
jgi:hypothetical protein